MRVRRWDDRAKIADLKVPGLTAYRALIETQTQNPRAMVAPPRAGSHLRRDSLGLSQIVASTLANIAPAMSFFFGFGVIVAGAGVGAPLTILLAMVVVLFLSNTLAEFSRYRPSTGSFVTFIGMSFGPVAGAAASIFVIVGYCIVTSSVVAISGGWAHSTWLLFVGGRHPLAAAERRRHGHRRHPGRARHRRLHHLGRHLLLFRAAPAAGRRRDHAAGSTAPPSAGHRCRPRASPADWPGVGAGFPLAIYLFIGWENSAMLAEETVNPRRNVPRALITGTLVIGVLYVFLAYGTEIAFHDNAAAIGKSAIPFVDAFKASAAGLLMVAYLAGLTSIFSSLIGAANSQARILFSSGREGLLPRVFGKIHPRHGTPHVAMWTFIIGSLAIVLIFGYGYRSTR